MNLIIIHGLNNNLECFDPLKERFEKTGFKCSLIILPGHGDLREEAYDLTTALKVFDERMKKLIQEPYVVIAFSQGALYFQIWLQRNDHPAPLAQVLLAPALFINWHSKIEWVINLLPSAFYIRSRTPKILRRYMGLYLGEYKTLLEGVRLYQSFKAGMRVPTLILIDPLDELVDAKILKNELEDRCRDKLKIILVNKPRLEGKTMGQHHVLFHPDWFIPKQWEEMTSEIESFLKSFAHSKL